MSDGELRQAGVLSVLLNPAEAAKALRTTVGTLAIWRCCQRYPLKYVRIGRKIFYKSEDVQRFIELRIHSGVNESQSTRRTR
jgi:hypothetical protein